MEAMVLYKNRGNPMTLLTEKNNKIRISPVKTRESLLIRKTFKPYSSSVIQ